jgi:beta-galactosidase GanA
MPSAILELLYDEEAPDPRESKHLGTIIAWHPDFNYGDPDAPVMRQSEFPDWVGENPGVTIRPFHQ